MIKQYHTAEVRHEDTAPGTRLYLVPYQDFLLVAELTSDDVPKPGIPKTERESHHSFTQLQRLDIHQLID
jgi:hypothetical protein